MKVLFYLPNYHWGGVANYWIPIINTIDRNKFEVAVMANFNTGPAFNHLKKDIDILPPLINPNIRLSFQLGNSILTLSKIAKKFDCLICCCELSTDYLAILSKLVGRGNYKIVTFIGTDIWKFIKMLPRRYPEYLLVKHLLQYADLTICVSKLLEKEIHFKLKNIKTTTLYAPISIEDLVKKSQEKSESIDEKENSPFLLSYGRFQYPKRFDIIIKAFSLLNLHKWKLIIIGEGVQKEKLKKLICCLRLDKKVLLLPYTDNPYRYLSRSYAFLFASEYEGMPVALPESFALGKPVIATPTYFGPMEIIKHNENGLISKDFQPENYALEIKKLLTDSKLYENLAYGAFKSAQNFDIKKIICQFEKILLTL